MQSYVWEEEYTGIFLRWCVGYLTDDELVAFLRKAAAHLYNELGVKTRQSDPNAFIIVLDNVAPPGQKWGPFDG